MPMHKEELEKGWLDLLDRLIQEVEENYTYYFILENYSDMVDRQRPYACFPRTQFR